MKSTKNVYYCENTYIAIYKVTTASQILQINNGLSNQNHKFKKKKELKQRKSHTVALTGGPHRDRTTNHHLSLAEVKSMLP